MRRPGDRTTTTRVRRRVRVRGIVQGVGFRPHVYALARSLDLAGAVWNDGEGVLLEIEGALPDVELFCHRVGAEAPPLSSVTGVDYSDIAPVGGTSFTIAASDGTPGRTFVSPDVTICDECLHELQDPADRRHRHPFITCTNCGPRFTITTALPYDRPNTTMAGFPMCPSCTAEYQDPGDRRFHAQTICCHDCGPRFALIQPGRAGAVYADEAMSGARRLLAEGAVVAVKGIGGYHLVCDARNRSVVAALRDRKRRGDKPFAVLVRDLDAAGAISELDGSDAGLLASRSRPVVLVRRRAAAALAEGVAPGSADVGVILAYAPVHHLLVGLPGDEPAPDVLVMTSGNLAGEPIVVDDEHALRRLSGLADAWLSHDRPIHVPADDSVTRSIGGSEAPIRRSRGHAPMALTLPFPSPPALGVGGDLKNTFCLAEGSLAWLSAHVGDLDDPLTLTTLDTAEAHLEMLTGVRPDVVAADRHPAYRSRRWAREHVQAQPVVEVQHHHAHVASTMVDCAVATGTRVIGVAFDGTGYGDDGAVWGGEFLVADYTSYQRRGHLAYADLPGGDAGVRNPCRMALSHLRTAGVSWDDSIPAVRACSDDELRLLDRQLEAGVRCVPTSSMGRLFDAVASIAGVCHRMGYDAQPAMELEAGSRPYGVREGYRFALHDKDDGWLVDPAPVLAAAAADAGAGTDPGLIGARFHGAIVAMVIDVALRLRDETGLDQVTLSGGVFLNALLTSGCCDALASAGLTVLRHHQVPASDAGLALGQVAVLAHQPRVHPSPDRRQEPPEQESPCA